MKFEDLVDIRGRKTSPAIAQTFYALSDEPQSVSEVAAKLHDVKSRVYDRLQKLEYFGLAIGKVNGSPQGGIWKKYTVAPEDGPPVKSEKRVWNANGSDNRLPTLARDAEPIDDRHIGRNEATRWRAEDLAFQHALAAALGTRVQPVLAVII
jgi:hypothetical protein